MPDINDNSMVTGIAGRPPTGTIRGRCAFAERCDFAIGACVEARIEMTTLSSTRRVRCIRATNATRREDGRRRGRVLAETAPTGPGVLTAQEITAVYRLPQGGVRIGVKASQSLFKRVKLWEWLARVEAVSRQCFAALPGFTRSSRVGCGSEDHRYQAGVRTGV